MLDIAASYHYMQFQGKLKNQTWKIEKNLVLGLIFANLAQIQAANFFLKIWLCQSLDAMVSYLHVQYQKKLQIQSLENLVTERQTDRPTEGQAHKSDSIGCCPTNIECPKANRKYLKKESNEKTMEDNYFKRIFWQKYI